MADLALSWLGHSTVVLDVGAVRVITDPLLRANAHPLRRRYPAPDRALWQGSDAVLLSHLHHDHAEVSSLRMLGDVPVYSAPANALWLQRRGLRGVSLSPEWAEIAAPQVPGRRPGTVEVRLTTAVHRSRPMPHRPNAANGHLLRSGPWRIYVVGDTSLFDGMSDIPDELGGPPELIVVPISGWGPRLSPGHLGPVEAAQVCALTGARRALAVHWGTLHPPMLDRSRAGSLGWMDAPLPEFRSALHSAAPDCELIDLRPGESWSATHDG